MEVTLALHQYLDQDLTNVPCQCGQREVSAFPRLKEYEQMSVLSSPALLLWDFH